MPDLTPIVEQYRDGTLPAESFIDVLQCGYTKNSWKRALEPLVEFPHKTMYDTAALCRVMKAAGFNARSAPPFVSAIDDIAAIENADRVTGAAIVEAMG